jgi:hypothetical protein
MKDAPQVLKPKGQFDRRLARLEQQRVWEYVGKTVLDDMEAIARAAENAREAYALAETLDEDGNPLSMTLKLKCRAMALDFERFAHQVRKETFQDRTIPTLARIDGVEALNFLPAPADEALGPVITDEEKSRQTAISLLRATIAMLETRGVDRPGLILLRRDDDVARAG